MNQVLLGNKMIQSEILLMQGFLLVRVDAMVINFLIILV